MRVRTSVCKKKTTLPTMPLTSVGSLRMHLVLRLQKKHASRWTRITESSQNNMRCFSFIEEKQQWSGGWFTYWLFTFLFLFNCSVIRYRVARSLQNKKNTKTAQAGLNLHTPSPSTQRVSEISRMIRCTWHGRQQAVYLVTGGGVTWDSQRTHTLLSRGGNSLEGLTMVRKKQLVTVSRLPWFYQQFSVV